MKHLLSMLSLSTEEITNLLNLADQLKYENKNGIKHHRLEGQTLGMIFQIESVIVKHGLVHLILLFSQLLI